MTTPNNNECYFKVDTIVENNLSTSNITTFDTKAKSISSSATFSVDGNATVKMDTKTTELTSAEKYNLNTTNIANRISINLHGNRLSNAAIPKNDCEPVPAFYIRSPEFYYTTLPADARARFGVGEKSPMELITYQTETYQSRNIGRACRIVNYDPKTKIATFPGTSYVQLLAKGTYIFSFGVTKRWGWNNGWGSSIYLKNAAKNDKNFSNTTINGGGGYPEQGNFGTIVQVTDPAPNPNVALGDYDKHIFYITQDNDFAALNSFFFSILFYPLEEFIV
ncbi:hypothetical protein [Chlamydia sp. 17-3921]|uniref:hypothetical protein n=1 Tax=Chlamydia sp. 17-3921 TaxID=2675798 RepID=UPI001917E77C|nr:hypothetical protein [Chlamydia sp. 17-3921]